jgi:hypothetical protein
MKKLVWIATISIGILLFSQCINSRSSDPRGRAYAGSASCVSCHKNIADSYSHTAHFHSASIASTKTIEGSFSPGSNIFRVNDTAKMVMELRDSIPYQVLYLNGREARAEPFQMVFGHSKGQAYLYWQGDQVYQLPLSWAMNQWVMSPGYPSGLPFFDRPVLARCYECHTSFATQSGSPNVNALDRSAMILNIDCERCHGPAAEHAAFHTESPGETKGRYIASFASLTRQQRIELCATCHAGGNNIQLRSIFGFKPGDTLSLFQVSAHVPTGKPDVHGDQLALLSSSKCYQQSDMECSTCHNTHVNDRGNFVAYAQRCQTCHPESGDHFCKLATTQNVAFLRTNCTRCHMPAQASNVIHMKTTSVGGDTAVFMINHRIAIYNLGEGGLIPDSNGLHPRTLSFRR